VFTTIQQFGAGVLYIAIIYMLVRPGSPASASVVALGDALQDLVKGATGYGQFSGGGS
jgi:hypothetical protein